MKELTIKKCAKCGATVQVLEDCKCQNCGIKCCGEEMIKVVPFVRNGHVGFIGRAFARPIFFDLLKMYLRSLFLRSVIC